MKKRYAKKAVLLLLTVCLVTGCFGCGSGGDGQHSQSGQSETSQMREQAAEKVRVAAPQDIQSVHLRDKDLLYSQDDETDVVTMYLTVSRGNASENTDHTWEEINTYSVYDYEEMGVERYQVNGLLQVGDENGPLLGETGYGESAPNATVQIRGQTSSRNAQKNYKIELKKNKGMWNGQRTINLNKHQSDGLRFRNKLAYKLLQGIPQLLSLRTQFVHLYVKDLTEGGDGVFEDYGLYTQVEQLNQTALRTHGLDENGHLYKVNFFEFFRYEDVIRTEDDPEFDRKAFEKHLEIKGDTDHTKLIGMLDALNDYSVPIEEILEEHFDRENLLYWMAFQILIGNVDTQSRNVYLYSPKNSQIWYLITWDNDACLSNTEYEIEEFSGKGSWECGVSNYWGNVLFQRCLKSERFRRELDEVIRSLRGYLTEERVRELAETYAQTVKPYVYRMPDIMYADHTPEEYDQILEAVPDEIGENYQMYLESLEKPMPFYIHLPELSGEELTVRWDAAYDFDAEDITYTVEIARDYLFEDVVCVGEDLRVTEFTTQLAQSGQYFVRIRATNESGQTQDAFDYYVTDRGKHFGMRCFYINEDRTVSEDVYEE